MRFVETGLAGAWLIEIEAVADERGMFARTYCDREFEERGIAFRAVQCNTSFNRRRGTLRGMHYQEGEAGEAKLVRCTRGAVFDVIVDLRPASTTRLQWFGAELSADNRRMFYVPKDFAHGFMTLVDDSEVFYQMSAFYRPDAARGVRWNDPALSIRWPEGEPILSPRDRAYPDVPT